MRNWTRLGMGLACAALLALTALGPAAPKAFGEGQNPPGRIKDPPPPRPGTNRPAAERLAQPTWY